MSWWRHHVIILITIATFLYCELSFSKRYDWRITMLDVGHGLAIILEKREKRLSMTQGYAGKVVALLLKMSLFPI
ncbi:hypothetical protein I3679_010965 [Proteus mirabilis]|uniref:Uncharacterized protein n=1 Tax=Proteus mirabilis TaxID=584 RepID=A0ABD5LWI3_PROMI